MTCVSFEFANSGFVWGFPIKKNEQGLETIGCQRLACFADGVRNSKFEVFRLSFALELIQVAKDTGEHVQRFACGRTESNDGIPMCSGNDSSAAEILL